MRPILVLAWVLGGAMVAAGTRRAALWATVECPFFAWGDACVARSASLQGLTVRASLPQGNCEVCLRESPDAPVCIGIGSLDRTVRVHGQELLVLDVSSTNGCPAILGVPDIGALAGRIVEVRDTDSGTAFLRGVLPPPLPRTRARAGMPAGRLDLQRPEWDGAGKSKGALTWTHDGTAGMLALEARWLANLPPFPADVPFFRAELEDSPGSGTFLGIGCLACFDTLSADGFELSRNRLWLLDVPLGTAPGTPDGLREMATMPGRRFRILDEAEEIRLEGIVPEATADPARAVRLRLRLVPTGVASAPMADGGIVVSWDPRQGRSRILLRVKGPVPEPGHTLWIENEPGSGILANGGELATGRAGLDMRRDTRRGDPLPLGLFRAVELSGRLLELRDPSGTPYLGGRLPSGAVP